MIINAFANDYTKLCGNFHKTYFELSCLLRCLVALCKKMDNLIDYPSFFIIVYIFVIKFGFV